MKRRSEKGAVSLEMALITPVLLLMIVGVAAIGHAMVVRFMLSSAAYDAARICALDRSKAAATCVQTIVTKKLGTTATWCKPLKIPTPVDAPESGFVDVRTLEVRVECEYGADIGKGYLKTNGIVLATLRARAVMPY